MRALSLSCVRHFVTLWTVPSRLLCAQESPGKNAGVGCHFLLQRISLTQGSNWCLLQLLHWAVDSLPLSSLENPLKVTVGQNKYDYETVYISVRQYLIIFKTLTFTMVLKERIWKITFLTFGHSIILLVKVKVKLLSRVQLFATPWTVAYQASLSMGFSRQESWSGLPFPSPGDFPNPGIEPRSPTL